jgi:hypothetical protein
VPEHLADRLVLPGRERLQHLQLGDHVVEAAERAAQQPLGRLQLACLDQPGRLLGLGPGELQPQLGGLVDGLEEQLVAVRLLARALLQGEQLVGAQVALVVAGALAGEDRLAEVLLAGFTPSA